MSESRQYCTFKLNGQFFGVEVGRVQEVIRHQPMTPVPLAGPAVRGLINLRGQTVVAVDLRRCLEMPPRAEEALPMNVVVRVSDRPVSLLVDEIGDVLDLSMDSFEPARESADAPERALFNGVHKLENQLLMVLDADRAVSWGTRA